MSCGVIETECRCIEAEGHDGAHVCDCKGSWTYDGDTLVPIVYPGGYATLDEAFVNIFGDGPA